MENNIYENEAVAETEQLQPEVQEVEIQQPEAPQSAENKLDVKKILNDGVDKAKELWANREALLQKVKSVPKKIWIMAGAGMLALIVVIVVLSLQGNTYKTPIAAAEKLLNMKSFGKLIDNAPSVLNGFGESEADKIIKILKKSDQYQDIKEDAEDAVDDLVEMLKDEYGSNYKIKIKIEDKEKLEKEDVKEFRDQLRSVADMTKELDELDSDDYEDMADELGISKSQAKEVIKTAKSFGKECKSAKVSDGYELEVVVTITGSELEEPMEQDMTVRVFKVDGRWVPDVFSLVNTIGIGSLYALLGDLF